MRSDRTGMSLVSVLIAAAIAAVLAVVIGKMLGDAFKGQKFAQQKDEVAFMRRSIVNAMRCRQTIPNPAVCDGITPIMLRDSSDQPITEPLIATGPLAGSGKFGEYYVRSTCSNVEKTLTVRMARARPDGTFIKDPMQNRDFDFLRPPNPIFGPNSPMCTEVLGASAGGEQCPAFRVMVGINADGSPNCVPLQTVMPVPSCPANQFMKGVRADGSADCRAAANNFTVPIGQLTALQPGCSIAVGDFGTFVAGCMNGGSQWCQARGFLSGVPISFVDVNNLVISCLGVQ